jgi:hypothetical protein
MEKLHPGARWQFRVDAYLGGLFLAFILFWMIFPVIFRTASEKSFIGALYPYLFAYIALVLALGELYARLSYNNWAYEFTEDGFKKERGIIWKKYSSIPYERIQNVDIHRGIIARMLGFSTLMIHTAGYSGMPSPEGHIPALSIEDAEKWRNFLTNKVSGKKASK